jgi:hypothetical protein
LGASVICVLAAFIVVDGVRRIVDQHARAQHAWALAALVAFLVYAIGLYVVVASVRGRKRLGFVGERAGTGPALLLAIAVMPVLFAAAAVFLGAATWSLWMAFGLSCVLVGFWCYQQRHA